MLGFGLDLPKQRGGVAGDPLASAVLALFAASEAGGWYDPSDLTTLFQDAAGSTPVTAHGDPVRRINDKSGNGVNLTCSADSTRPLYQTDGALHWLLYDGTDDALTTTSMNLTSVKSVAGGVAFRKGDDSETGTAFYLGSGSALTTFRVNVPNTTGGNNFRVNGVNGASNQGFNSTATVGEDVAASMEMRIDTEGPYFEGRKNGTSLGSTTASMGTTLTTWGSGLTFHLGSTAAIGEFFGRIYGGVLLGRHPTAGEFTAIDNWLKAKAGL